MPLDGNGNYEVPAGTEAVTGTVVASPAYNAFLADLESVLSNVLFKDGQAASTDNIPMGGFKLTGLGAGSALADSARLTDIQKGSCLWLSSPVGTDTYSGNLTSPTLDAYNAGLTIRFIVPNTNTGPSTLNINGLGAKTLKKRGNADLASGDLLAGDVATFTYDGTVFRRVDGNTPSRGASADIASAATLNLTSRTGDIVRITGTTTSTAITMNNGDVVLAIAAAAWPINVAGVLTYTCTAEDVVLLTQDDDGVQKAAILVGRAGTGNIGPVELATAAEAQAGNAINPITGATLKDAQIQCSTPVATTSGTSVTLYNSIPATAKEINVHLNGVSTNGTSPILVKVVTASGTISTGYVSNSLRTPGGAVPQVDDSTAGFIVKCDNAVFTVTGVMTIRLADVSGKKWSQQHSVFLNASQSAFGAGFVDLTEDITGIVIETENAVDTFDAGAGSVSWS